MNSSPSCRKLDPTLRDIVRCILVHEECMTPQMVKRFLDWIELREIAFSAQVLHQHVFVPKQVARILNCSERTVARLGDQNRIQGIALSGKKRHGYWGDSVFDLVTGKTDAHLRELKRHRALSRGSKPADVGLTPLAPNQYKLKTISNRAILLLKDTFYRFDGCYDQRVLDQLLAMLQHELWRFSIPRRFFCILTQEEVCKKLSCSPSKVKRLIRARKILPIQGYGNRALGYSGPSVWKFLLERHNLVHDR